MKEQKSKSYQKIIRTIDFILIVGSLVLLLGFVGYVRPLVISPLNGTSTTQTDVLFQFERGERIIIDDNPEFSSPETYQVLNGTILSLKPGQYYWKVIGAIGESEIRSLKVESLIDLRLRKSNYSEGFELINAGNSELDVKLYDNSEVISQFVLKKGFTKEIPKSEKVIGGLNEN